MDKKSSLTTLYYVLAVVGFIVTWYYNGQYILGGGGLGPSAFFGAAFANVLTTAITIDVYLATLVFSVWAISDSKHTPVKWPWLYVVLSFGVGLAIALPLYLASREKILSEVPSNVEN
jgi:magnesium-transporting ATPase (P-type)